jgi:DNA-binding transcriptional MerR regulator
VSQPRSQKRTRAAARRAKGESDSEGRSYSVKAVVKATGLSAHVLRAWERRYRAVEPERTEGGTRRYRESDVRRLRLLRRAVDAGHPIGSLAHLSDAQLDALLEGVEPVRTPPRDEILAALERLDARATERMLSVHFAALGPRAFAFDVAAPLLAEIGRRWERGRLRIATEHLASAILRSILGSAVRATDGVARGRPVLFATPSGERHELGLLVAALVAAANGTHAVYLGPDLPDDEIAHAVGALDAGAVALGITMPRPHGVQRYVSGVRRHLGGEVELWVGGGATETLRAVRGVRRLADFRELERAARVYAEHEHLRA